MRVTHHCLWLLIVETSLRFASSVTREQARSEASNSTTGLLAEFVDRTAEQGHPDPITSHPREHQ